jgi:hypothetical protein
MQMLYKARPKRRLVVNHLSESGNRGASTCLGSGTSPLRVSVGRNRATRKPRAQLPATSPYDSHGPDRQAKSGKQFRKCSWLLVRNSSDLPTPFSEKQRAFLSPHPWFADFSLEITDRGSHRGPGPKYSSALRFDEAIIRAETHRLQMPLWEWLFRECRVNPLAKGLSV